MTNALDNSILDTLQSFERAPNTSKVKEVFRRAVEKFGFTSFMCSAPPRPEEVAYDPVLFDAWPIEWRARYRKRRYHLHDPMLRELYRTANPFTWSAVMQHSSPSPDGAARHG